MTGNDRGSEIPSRCPCKGYQRLLSDSQFQDFPRGGHTRALVLGMSRAVREVP